MKAVDDAMWALEAALFTDSDTRKAAIAAFGEAVKKMTQPEKDEAVRRCDALKLRLDLMERAGPPTGEAS